MKYVTNVNCKEKCIQLLKIPPFGIIIFVVCSHVERIMNLNTLVWNFVDFHISIGKDHDVSSSRRSFGYNCVGCTERDFFFIYIDSPRGNLKNVYIWDWSKYDVYIINTFYFILNFYMISITWKYVQFKFNLKKIYGRQNIAINDKMEA